MPQLEQKGGRLPAVHPALEDLGALQPHDCVHPVVIIALHKAHFTQDPGDAADVLGLDEHVDVVGDALACAVKRFRAPVRPDARVRENTALEKGVVDAVELEKLGQVRQPLAHEPIALALLIADLAQPAFDRLRHRQVLLAQPAVERACHPV